MYYIEWEHRTSGDRGVRPKRTTGTVNVRPMYFASRAKAERYVRDLNTRSAYYTYRVRPVNGYLQGGPYRRRKEHHV